MRGSRREIDRLLISAVFFHNNNVVAVTLIVQKIKHKQTALSRCTHDHVTALQASLSLFLSSTEQQSPARIVNLRKFQIVFCNICTTQQRVLGVVVKREWNFPCGTEQTPTNEKLAEKKTVTNSPTRRLIFSCTKKNSLTEAQQKLPKRRKNKFNRA